ncbi:MULTISPECIES: ABC transporter permease [Terrisporobacter]|uniref:ABC transporter permease n=1 Tax=Terrisporobacter muris TaxID=2963284 RepID=A0A9X2M6Y3_9FIRM|nr:ABC transporter permease [Terrisporobacter othiniensis]MCR1821328.1 ABC transporter permease [Terrisporobacter muris]MDY3372263.1 ABC transporter permease [Terrisporobacter othiniensis]
MFYHNYKYRIKCIVRDRQMMFWTLLFPIVLATLFNLALRNLSSAEDFSIINIAIVKDEKYKENKEFLEVIKSVSDNKSDDDLFHIEYTSKDKAKERLDDNAIEGYIFFDKDINVVVKKSGINQTIIKSFVDEYKQTSSTIKTILQKNPQAISSKDFSNIFERTNYIKEVAIGRDSPDISVNYFYTLIAMACLYGGFFGLKEIASIQANQSFQGARTSVAPAHKLKIATSSIAAATTVQLFNIGALIAYISLALNVSFSNQLGYIILICIVGTITGVTFGTCIGAILKKKEGIKIGIVVGSTMMMSYLAGMMNDKIKYIVSSKMPILSYINPVNLIADSFYSMYYYDTTTKLFINLSILCLLSIIFSVITYLVLRRQKYASL